MEALVGYHLLIVCLLYEPKAFSQKIICCESLHLNFCHNISLQKGGVCFFKNCVPFLFTVVTEEFIPTLLSL